MNGFYYPRVMVVSGYTFSFAGGGSITLSNLFRGWPIDKLAIIDADSNLHDENLCENRFNLAKIGSLNRQNEADLHSSFKTAKYIKNRFAKFLGVAGGVRPIPISKSMRKFIQEFGPEVIYTQASQLSYISLVQSISRMTGAKVIYHFMDDFPSTTYTRGLLSSIVRRRMLRQVSALVSDSAVRMGISDAMSDAFQIRYGVPFVTFHNPLELSSWLRFSKLDYSISSSPRIVYTGRIGTAVSSSMHAVCDAVRRIRENGVNISFHIYTQLPLSSLNIDIFGKFGDAVSLHEAPQDVSDMARILGCADILVLPNDFDQNSIKFIQYSMPTKIPSYMISGTPILVFGPPEIYSVQYAKSEKWGYVVENNDVNELMNAIALLSRDKVLRESLGKFAKNLAETRYDSKVVLERFRLNIASSVNESKDDIVSNLE